MQRATMQQKFIETYDKSADAIFRYCYFKLYDRERARELMQETFTKAWDYIMKNNKDIENITGFLYKIAKNLIIDEIKKKSGKNTLSLDQLKEKGFDPGEDHSSELKSTIDNQSMLTVIENLEGKYREVIWLRYIDDLSVKEIAQALDESENNVSVRIHRALTQLRNLLPNG